jgi:hypothetical protein
VDADGEKVHATDAGLRGGRDRARDDEWERERGDEQRSGDEQATDSRCVRQDVVIPSGRRTISGSG